MSDIEVKARLTAINEASPIILKFKRDIDALAASLRRISTFSIGSDLNRSLQRVADQHGEIASQVKRQAYELRSAGAAQRALNSELGKAGRLSIVNSRAEARRQSDTLTFNRGQISFMSRMARQRVAEDRQREAEHRNAIRRIDRERSAAGRGAASHGRQAYDRTTGGTGRATRSAGMAGALGLGATALAARKVLSAEVDLDSAEIGARIYGGLGKDAARALRLEWAGNLSEALGVATADLMRAYTDAIKAGIPEAGAKPFASLATKVSEAWELPFSEVVEVLATTNTILTSGGKAFDIDRVHSVANSIQHLAASMATTPQKMISFLRRGAGAAQLLGMSQEAGLAFGAASTSLGNEAFSSGRAFDYLAGRIAELPRIMRRNGDDAREARKIVGQLGYGSLSQMMMQQKADPDAFLFDFLDRFNRIQDPQKRNESLRWFAGQEWLGELGRMVTGMSTVREAQSLAEEAKGLDAIGKVWELHQTKLLFAFKQIKAGFQNVLGEAGIVLSPLAGQVRDYFMQWTTSIRQGGLKTRLSAAIDGLIEGFGFRNLPELLTGIFGQPGTNEAGAIDTWRKVARGFAAGITDVGSAVKSTLSVFARDGDAESMSRWAARLLGFSMAARIAQPAFDLLGGFGTVLLGLANAVLSFVAIRRVAALAGLLGGGTAVAGAAAGAASLPLILTGIAAGIVLGVTVMNWPKIMEGVKAVGDFWSFVTKGPQDPEWQKRIDDAKRQQTGPFEALGRALKELFGISSAKAGELPASFKRSAVDLRDSMDRLGTKVQFASLSGAAASVASSFAAPAASAGRAFEIGGSSGAIGNGIVNPRGLTRRGILGGDLASGSPGAGLYDAIINAEGTARGGRDPYNTVLGYGRWGSPSKNLTDMTLNEVREHGLAMKRAQLANGTAWKDTSSASGAFQIVGNTMMDAARALGIDPASTKFTPEIQRQMAAWIARTQGLGAWEGFRRHSGELAKARTAMSGGSHVAALGAGLIPVKASGGSTVLVDPRNGFGQAFAGGATHAGTLAAAKAIVGADIAGGLQRFTGFNDSFHAGRNSKHAFGLAGDFTLKDPTKSAEAAEQLRNAFRAAGLAENMFKVIDEYRNPSRHSTGGHLHYQFNSPEAADQYAAHQRAKALAAQTPSGLASSIPFTPPAAKPGGMFDPNDGAGVSGFNAPITINGANQSPEEIANAVQRHIQEAMNWRTHDVESELT